MTPSKERKMISDVRGLIAANAEMNKRQDAEIGKLVRRIDVLSSKVNAMISKPQDHGAPTTTSKKGG